tara:strand:- start:113 stop:532 length:420 start_codon:yes stop_codon:yes gene_type:complete
VDTNQQKKPREWPVSNVRAYYALSEARSMFEVWFGVALGLLVASNVALWLKLDRCYVDLHRMIENGGKIIEQKVDIDGIKDEIHETIQDFMGNLHVPTAGDHLLGSVGQILQMWGMKRFGNMAQMAQQIVQPQSEEFEQ